MVVPEIIIAIFNLIRYTYVRPDDRAYGLKNADGSWSGMVGQVYREVSVETITITVYVPYHTYLYI